MIELQKEIHQIAVEHGWWDTDRNHGEILMLIVTEVAEAMEAIRRGDKENLSEEMADIVIRVLDAAEAWGIDMDLAIERKVEINRHRPYRHGGKLA